MKITADLQAVFDYFQFEKTGKETILLGGFTNKDFRHWLTFVHDSIQSILHSKSIEGNKIENYINITMYLGGQRVDFAIVKDGCKGPHELLQDAKLHLRARRA